MVPKPDIDYVLEEFLDIEHDTGPETLESELLRSLVVATLRLEDVSSDLSKTSLELQLVRHTLLKGLYNIRYLLEDVINKIERIDKKE
ncbi:MAG TPA: hypothetical protein VMX17_12105 [Candidatus Glassbacteria bacterium]|nr:hypothetical protein [Candidatus Glassbacteria bacterium]